MATISIVATPIGNLEDITLRALNVLKSADVVLCEDTRITKRLLDKYEIKKPLLSYHAHSKISRENEIVALLRSGKNLALVSDAGTPGISDPGSKLVHTIRTALKDELTDGRVKIEIIPGPSAFVAALAISGINTAHFCFLGFLPHKKGRETLFKDIATRNETVIFYESTHRILKTLQSLTKEEFAKKTVTICRELTKIYEEVVQGSPLFVMDYFQKNPDKVRGEFAVIVSP